MRFLTSFRSTAFGTSLLLLLGFAAPAAQAQTTPAAPARAAAPSLYFLDGQPSTQQAINQLNRRTIASVNVITEPDATRIFGPEAAGGVMVVVTKRNVGSAAVAEFNQRYRIGPREEPVPATKP